MPLVNRDGVPYTGADAFKFLQMLRNGGFKTDQPSHKFSTTFGPKILKEPGQKGLKDPGSQKSIVDVLKQKHELSTNIGESYREHNRKDGSKDALFDLGRYAAFKSGAVFIGPDLKGLDGVVRKVMNFKPGKERGYEGNYALMKDEVRITLAADSQKVYNEACDVMRAVCNAANGLSFIKDKSRDHTKDPCGYSDTNMVVRLPNGEPGEVQINVRAILFGKMSEKDYVEQLGGDKADYMQLKMRYGIEGGLGHLFYEIYDRYCVGTPEGALAARLSTRYYAILRSYPNINLLDRQKLIEEIKAYKQLDKVKDYFKH
jgi:hypothetical protein